MKFSIYRFTNKINGKVYIGKTINDPLDRKKDHIQAAAKNSHLILHCAIRKYGIDNFDFDVIYNTFSDSTLSDAEIHFIREYDCCILDGPNKGYNMTHGGEGFDPITAGYWGKKQILDGTHNFYGGEIQHKRVANGTHHLLSGEIQKRAVNEKVRNGTFHMLKENREVDQGTINLSKSQRPIYLKLKKLATELGVKLGSGISMKSDEYLQELFDTLCRSSVPIPRIA